MTLSMVVIRLFLLTLGALGSLTFFSFLGLAVPPFALLVFAGVPIVITG